MWVFHNFSAQVQHTAAQNFVFGGFFERFRSPTFYSSSAPETLAARTFDRTQFFTGIRTFGGGVALNRTRARSSVVQ